MLTFRKILAALLFSTLYLSVANAQIKMPPETRNAALRYWSAFAEMQDTGADKSTADLIVKTLSGEIPWNESQLGKLIDDNKLSIQIMQRATKLPECDWGLEYELGPDSPVTFLKNSALSLGRLNTMYGIRLAAKGNMPAAVDSWLAGIQFSRHLAQGQSLFGNLIAASVLRSNLHFLAAAAGTKPSSELEKSKIAKSLRAMPETGFDWGLAMGYEAIATNASQKMLAASSNPTALYQQWFGAPPANFSMPKSDDVAAYNKLIAQMEGALRLDPSQAQEKLKVLENSEKSLHPFFQNSIPSLVRINDTRKQIQAERQALLDQLSAK